MSTIIAVVRSVNFHFTSLISNANLMNYRCANNIILTDVSYFNCQLNKDKGREKEIEGGRTIEREIGISYLLILSSNFRTNRIGTE